MRRGDSIVFKEDFEWVSVDLVGGVLESVSISKAIFRWLHVYLDDIDYVFKFETQATIFPTNVFRKINGYSNRFCGWGGEDDDMRFR